MTHVIYLNLSIYSSVRAYTAVNGDRDRVILCTTPCACRRVACWTIMFLPDARCQSRPVRYDTARYRIWILYWSYA